MLWLIPPFLLIFAALVIVLARFLPQEGPWRSVISHAWGLGASLVAMAAILVAILPSGLLDWCGLANGYNPFTPAPPAQLSAASGPALGVGNDEAGAASGRHPTPKLEAQALKLLDRLSRELSRTGRAKSTRP